MSIKNRLKKAESAAKVNNSGYCRCYGDDLKYEVIPFTIDEMNQKAAAGEETCERLPDFCERCRKPVNKVFIEVTFEDFQERTQRRLQAVADDVERRSEGL